MSSLIHVLAFVLILACTVSAKDLLPKGKKDDKPSEVTIHATNNTQVPGVHYIVDAVECLKEAYAVYTVDADRAKLYVELFQEKHNETEWNVVVGYTAAYIKSSWYVETSVTPVKNKSVKSKKDDKETTTLFLIFSNE